MLLVKKHQLLPFLKPYLPDAPIIVEAGAFNGNDTKMLAAYWPAGTVHAFEPVPEIFALLEKNTQDIANIKRYNVALGEQTGTATFYVSQKPEKPDKPFQAGSLLKPKERLKLSNVTYPCAITVPTITLDDWATQHHIDRVDFLWLDLQGMELNVLKAASSILKTVTAIYTEVEFVEAYEGQYLHHDVVTWLQGQGFAAAAKDFENESDWFYGNILFIRQ